MGRRALRWGSLSIAAGMLAVFGIVAAAPPALGVVIQPGSSLLFGDSYCTANWVYDGGGGPYIGAAAHCTTGVGQEVQLSTMSLGSPIEAIGTVAYVGQGDMDYCLIRIYPSVVGQLSAAMAGHPNIPTGVSTTSSAQLGDLVQFSGHGVGFDLTTVTQQQRIGVFQFFDDGLQYVIGPVLPGDSGGPVADITDGNKALGIVDTVGAGIVAGQPTVGEAGVALYALLQDAAAHGFNISLRTV